MLPEIYRRLVTYLSFFVSESSVVRSWEWLLSDFGYGIIDLLKEKVERQLGNNAGGLIIPIIGH